MFVDAYDYSIVPDKSVYSIYERIPAAEKVNRISAWEENNKKFSGLAANKSSTGITSSNLQATTQSMNVLNVNLFAQQQSNYCAPAVGQMIADYYGVHWTQTDIAGMMHTGPSGTNLSNMLNFYRNDLGKSNSGVYNVLWQDMVYEIDQGYPFANLEHTPAGDHVRTGAGYWIWFNNDIYFKDPYPVNQGSTYWEATDYWFLPNYANIYVY